MSGELVGLALVIGAYFAGSFPTASIIGMISGHDHSQEGSGNPGASNVYRTSGAGYGIITVVLDAMKAIVPVLIALWFFDRQWAAVVWLAATLGHVFPLARWGNGGKGVATAGGGTIVLHPFLAILCLAIFGIVVSTTRLASLGSLAMAAIVLFGVVGTSSDNVERICAILLAALVVARHRRNIARLISGEELKIG